MKIALAADTLMQWEGGRRFFALLLDGLEDSLAPGDILRVVSEPARDAMLWRVARVGRQILSGRATRKWVAAELSKTSKAQQIRSLVGGRRKIIWRDRAWPLAQDGFDVVGPIQRRLGWTANIGSVGYIVDMQHKFIPELFSDEELKKRDLLFQWTLDHCPVVVLNSETARTHVQQFLNVGNCRLVVLPIAAYADPKWLSLCVADVQRQYAIKEPYFICSNQFWAHKNHSVIFHAVRIATDRGVPLSFVFTGPTWDHRRPDYFASLRRLTSELGITDRIRILGLVPKEEQIALMRGAIAAVQPTLFEGQPGGGGIYDAIAVGQRSIVSDIPVNRELGAAAIYFDPQNPDDLFDKLKSVLNAPAPAVDLAGLLRETQARRRAYALAARDAFAGAAVAARVPAESGIAVYPPA